MKKKTIVLGGILCAIFLAVLFLIENSWAIHPNRDLPKNVVVIPSSHSDLMIKVDRGTGKTWALFRNPNVSAGFIWVEIATQRGRR